MVFRLTPLVKNTVRGGLVGRPNDGAFIRAASSKDWTTRLGLRVGALLHLGRTGEALSVSSTALRCFGVLPCRALLIRLVPVSSALVTLAASARPMDVGAVQLVLCRWSFRHRDPTLMQPIMRLREGS